MSAPRIILVAGATGRQGSAVVRHLAKANSNSPSAQWKIHAITRDSSSDKARSLISLPGVKLVQGDPDHPESFFAGGDIYGVFFMHHNRPHGTTQNKAFIDASAKHGVKHYVHSGLDFCNDTHTDIPMIEDVRRAEQDLQNAPFITTFVRPVGFMENFYAPFFVQYVSSKWVPTQQYKTVAIDDIGKVVAAIFAEPQKFDGKAINLAGHTGTRDEIIALAKETTGQVWDFKGTPDLPPFLLKPYQYWDEHAFAADPKECHELFPGLTDLRTWFKNSSLPAVGVGAQPSK